MDSCCFLTKLVFSLGLDGLPRTSDANGGDSFTEATVRGTPRAGPKVLGRTGRRQGELTLNCDQMYS